MLAEVSESQLIGLIGRAAVEALALLLVCWIAWAKAGLREAIAPLGSKKQLTVVLVASLMVAIQLTDRWQYFYPQPFSSYPLTRFAMYSISDVREEAVTYEILAVFDDGTVESINLTTTFSAIGLPSLNTRMMAISTDLDSDDVTVQAAAQNDFALFISAELKARRQRGDLLPVSVTMFRDTYDVATSKRISREALDSLQGSPQ